MGAPELKECMFQIAVEYDRLAEVVERASAPRDAAKRRASGQTNG
jgi:hypothetical protein